MKQHRHPLQTGKPIPQPHQALILIAQPASAVVLHHLRVRTGVIPNSLPLLILPTQLVPDKLKHVPPALDR